MKKLTIKGVMNTLQGAAIDGAVVYGGQKAFQVASYKLNNWLTTNLTGTSNPALTKGVVGVAAIVAADLFLPKKYAELASIGIATEVIEAFVAPTLDQALVKANLISNQDAARGLLAASAQTAAPASTQGYVMQGYAPTRMGGYASVRGLGIMDPSRLAG
jgi:hypothetical protein